MVDTPALSITPILSFIPPFAKDKLMTAAWIWGDICKHTVKNPYTLPDSGYNNILI